MTLLGKMNKLTRFGPNRPAADTEANAEFDFWVIYEDLWRILNFLRKTFILLYFVRRTSRFFRPSWPPNSLRGQI